MSICDICNSNQATQTAEAQNEKYSIPATNRCKSCMLFGPRTSIEVRDAKPPGKKRAMLKRLALPSGEVSKIEEMLYCYSMYPEWFKKYESEVKSWESKYPHLWQDYLKDRKRWI